MASRSKKRAEGLEEILDGGVVDFLLWRLREKRER